MSLLTQILSTEKKNLQVGAANLTTTANSPPLAEISSFPPRKNSPGKFSLCKKCSGSFFWKSHYDEILHCAECSPWPSPRMVRQKIFLTVEDVEGRDCDEGDDTEHLPLADQGGREGGGGGATPPELAGDEWEAFIALRRKYVSERESAILAALRVAQDRYDEERRAGDVDVENPTRCRKCHGEEFVEVAIHGGESVRVDCRKCRAFVKFGKWMGTT